jgi:hypothetical protein
MTANQSVQLNLASIRKLCRLSIEWFWSAPLE